MQKGLGQGMAVRVSAQSKNMLGRDANRVRPVTSDETDVGLG